MCTFNPIAVFTTAITPAHIPRSRRRSKLTGLARPRKTFHGPTNNAPAVRNSAGYAVAMLRWEIRSRRSENNIQKIAVPANVAKRMTTWRVILCFQYRFLVVTIQPVLYQERAGAIVL